MGESTTKMTKMTTMTLHMEQASRALGCTTSSAAVV
jgi:hypothetical protein